MKRPTNSEEINALAIAYQAIEVTKKQVDQQLKDVREKLIAACDGQAVTETGEFIVKAKIGTTFEWDQDVLSRIAGNPLIKKKLTVSKTDFEKASPECQKELMHALTVKKGRVSVSVTPIEED